MVVIEKISSPKKEKKLSQKQFELLSKNKDIFEGRNVELQQNVSSDNQNTSASIMDYNNTKNENVTSQQYDNSQNLLQQFLPLLELISNKNDKSKVSEALMKLLFKNNPQYAKMLDIMKLSNSNLNNVSSQKKEDIKISSFIKTDQIED